MLDGVAQLYKDEQEERCVAEDAKKKEKQRAEDDRNLGLQIRADATKSLKDKKTVKGKRKILMKMYKIDNGDALKMHSLSQNVHKQNSQLKGNPRKYVELIEML